MRVLYSCLRSEAVGVYMAAWVKYSQMAEYRDIMAALQIGLFSAAPWCREKWTRLDISDGLLARDRLSVEEDVGTLLALAQPRSALLCMAVGILFASEKRYTKQTSRFSPTLEH
jgi:hypothetical protein